MKQKILKLILPLCIAMAMTACGGNADTTEIAETAATEKNTDAEAEAEAKTEAEAKAEAKAEAEEQARLKEAGEYYEAGRKSLYGLDGSQINIEDAYANFIKAQELGNTDANFYLGALADADYGYPQQNYAQASAYYEQSGNNPYAQIALGCLYSYGRGVELDMEKSKELFQSAVDQGVVEGYYGLAMVAVAEEDSEAAVENLTKVVDEGTEQLFIAKAMNYLGTMYQYGFGATEPDIAKAMEWFEKAVELDNTTAMLNLGVIYYYGYGVEPDDAKAMEWFEKAVDLNDAGGMAWLAVLYRDGYAVEQDYNKTIEWYTKAAERGNTNAMHNLATMYMSGNEVEKDLDKAIEWLTKAAELGDELSKMDLEMLQ